ncbi:MAG: ABC transporter permease subunit [Methanoregula sp.]
MTLKLSAEGYGVIALFIATLLLAVAMPDAPNQVSPSGTILFAGVLVFLLAAFLASLYFHPKESQAVSDIFLLIAILAPLWEIAFGKLSLLDPLLFPGPARVFAVFGNDYELMLQGLVSSLALLGAGYALALATAIPIGLYLGWRKRLFNVAYPLAKAISPIPPTAYLPYTIVLLPSFASASIFLIFISAFWPILIGAVYGVFSIDYRLINSAKTLGISEKDMIKKVLFPGALPSIFSGAMIAFILSFITLTVAEMLAATSGLGWYIQYNHDFANYDKVVAGIILVAVVVIVLMYFFDRIQSYCLRWQTP